jgi:hypothetical protein
MAKAKQPARAFSFAHLLGRAGVRADDGNDTEDEMKQGEDESDEDYAKRMEEEDNKQRDGESDADYAKRMEEKDKDVGDDDDNTDDADDEKEKAGAVEERARCAAIFACSAAATRPDVAAHLAFQTDMSSAAAIGMLNTFAAGGAPAKQSLASRMANVRVPVVGASAAAAAANPAAAAAAAILAAGRKRRGEA